MKVTNKAGLPDAIVRAVKNDGYSKGDADYSVTELLKPPRAVSLERAHETELEEDASDRIWSMFGQAVHVIAERANHSDVAERRLYIEVDGVTVSGGMDLYIEGDATYIDYKTTSVWKARNGIPEEWVQQINLYAAILRVNNIAIKRARVLAIFRDWSKLESLRDATYPPAQCQYFEIPLWEPEKALAFLKARVAIHEAAKEEIPECTSEERWAKPDVFAVMKEGRASAVKLHSDRELAEEHAKYLGEKHYVQWRPGMQTRCEAYCKAAPFCEQFKKLKEGK